MKKNNKFFLSNLTKLIILIILIILGIYLYRNIFIRKEYYTEENKIEIIVARYNEKLEWLNEEPFNKYPVIIYNKSSNDDFIKSKMIKNVINLDNVGRESHTYLYHVINNYDNLADFTIFLPGSSSTDYKKVKALNVFKNISQNNNDIFSCNKENLYESQKNFTIDNYLSTNEDNKNINADAKILISDKRPFSTWYDHFFKNKDINCITYNSIFAVSKKTILNKPIEFYVSLLNEVDKDHNPETNHYLERSWASVFNSNDNQLYV